ncbi:hypothetical protein GCM10011504_25280 [Siccirubricoccus deserti]|uniref:Glycosyltransferase family 4 protein n=1 Tax=Siccirubricoccus deserti TaxID=2013562 RepID=A0A9X0UDY8_9PROT|nr:glycosyltransferase family 4 protein [Siccirubricoccus deserti]MBC4016138.1 glycosyltransferase family 4 protein [Siccirubricoccus deserti]GGC45748.1 hypothetical protein GCM10011504_25280 [Siccirubricoccus deserti]
MTRRLRRLLVLLPSAGLGGAEAHTATLARDLAAAGVAVTLAIAPALAEAFGRMLGPGFATRLHAAEIDWRVDASPASNIARQAMAGAELVAAVAPDAVLLPLPWPSHGLGLMRALAGTPALAIAHLAPAALPDAEVAAARTAPAVHWVAVSAPVAARVATTFALPPDRILVIPNGVEVPPEDPAARAAARAAKRALLGLPPKAPLLIFAGRLDPAKGADLLPGIAAALASRATIAVLGAGPLRTELEGGALRLLGRVSDVPDWLLAADALLLPSRLEGCPLIFLEAAARHCPVIATAAALEAFPEAAGLAALAPGPGAARLAELAALCLADPAAARAVAAAAHRQAVLQQQSIMLGQYCARLRALPA